VLSSPSSSSLDGCAGGEVAAAASAHAGAQLVPSYAHREPRRSGLAAVRFTTPGCAPVIHRSRLSTRSFFAACSRGTPECGLCPSALQTRPG
jgi:hypothetical protein